MAKTAKNHHFVNFNVCEKYQRRQDPTENFDKMCLIIIYTYSENICLGLGCAGFQNITFTKKKIFKSRAKRLSHAPPVCFYVTTELSFSPYLDE